MGYEARMKKLKSWRNWIIIILGVVINFAGKGIAIQFNLPFWLDSIGTMLSAIYLGPVPGVICGVIFNAVASAADASTLPYMIVSASIGVSIGLLYPRNESAHFRVMSSAVITGLIAAAISTPINLVVYDGTTGNAWGDTLMDMLSRDIHVPLLNSFLGEAFVDVPDKAVSLLIAIAIVKIGHEGKKLLTAGLLPLVLAAALLSGIEGIKAEASDFGSEYAGITYNAENGLETVEINAIAQTSDGYIWVGSYAGIYKFDGHKFVPANLDSRIKNVMVMFVDSQGRLWIGTNDSGIACYDPVTKEVDFYDTSTGLASDAIRSVTEDKNGTIFVATITHLCAIYPDGKVEAFNENSFNGIEKLASSGDTVAGVRGDGSLIVFRGRSIMYVLAGDYTEVTEGEDGDYIVGTGTNLTGTIYIKNGYTDLMTKRYAGKLSYYNAIVYSKTFKGYFVACENGLGFITDKGNVTDLSADGFDSSVSDICVDYQGNVWFASSKQGIKKFSWNPFEDIFSRAKVDPEVVNAVVVKGGLLYAATNNGLVTIDLKTYYSVPVQHPEMFKDIRIRHILHDSKDNMWYSTYGPDCLIEVKHDGTILTFTDKDAITEGNKFRLCKELSDGTILAVSNTGLNFIENDRVVTKLGEAQGLTTPVICLAEDEDGTIYAGTDGGGVYVIRDRKLYKTILSADGLRSLVVMKIVPCTGGFIYVTSNALYYDNHHEIRRLESFPYSNNYDIYISEDGEAWVFSSGGIFVVDETDLLNDDSYSYVLLNRSRGLHTSITSNASYTINGERLYIPCTDGVRRVSTKNYDSFNNEYEIALSAVMLGDELIEPENGVYNLPATNGRVMFDVAVMNYSFSNPLVHIFLEGMDDEGITRYQKDLQELSFTNLSYGDYKLHVQVMDTTGNVILRDEVFPVHKESQLYERGYFKAYLAVVGFLFIMYIGWAIGDLNQNMNNVKRLKQEATQDPLTGLYNKRGAKDALCSAFSKSAGILALIDLDSFKPVNDIYGHDMGDRILIELANLMDRNTGPDDVLCRVGGDEFVIFFNGITENQLEQITKELNERIVDVAMRVLGHDMNIPIGVSVGAVNVPRGDYDDYVKFFKKADKALYVVKNSGKHGYVMYEEDLFKTIDGSDRANVSGIAELRTILGERSKNHKPYRVEHGRLQDIYRLLERLGDSSVINSVMIQFTLSPDKGHEMTELVMETFQNVVTESLRSTDVYGYDHHKSVLVIITNTDENGAKVIVDRILEKWKEEPLSKGYLVAHEKEML